MTDDPVLAAVQRFMDAVEAKVGALTGETRALLTEARSALTEMQTRSAPIGPMGERGLTGERGEPGPAGKDGRDGVDGKDGRDGKDGERGADGLAGRDGAPGERGERGERGADGIATRAELELLIAERFAELQVRTLADSWRGVWSPTETYQRGNVAQWDGSPWLALADKPESKPGTSKEWVLFAKKGRDGSR